MDTDTFRRDGREPSSSVNGIVFSKFKWRFTRKSEFVLHRILNLSFLLAVALISFGPLVVAQEVSYEKDSEQKRISIAEKELLSWGRFKDPKFDSLYKFEFSPETNSVYVNSGHPWANANNTFYFDELNEITRVRLADGSYERMKENVFVKKEKGLLHVHTSFEGDVWCGDWIVNDKDNQLIFRSLTKADLTPKGRSIFVFTIKPEFAQNSRLVFRRNDSDQHFFLVISDFLAE